ncbi:MAG: cobalamin B12-binding domain-containing protein [Candidatus Bathyarchaeia archaeon]
MNPIIQRIRDHIVELDLNGAGEAVEEALKMNVKIEDILKHGVGSAMEEIGLRYERGEYFISELVMGGSVVKELLGKVLPILRQTGRDMFRGKVVIGTVEGDLHDIGKMIVTSFLLGAGFEVVDLGVDVPAGRFVDAVSEGGADIVAMSCLLTTTLPSIGKTVEALKSSGLRSRVKVLVGGHAVTEGYAKEVGADSYGADGPDAVRKAILLLGG